MSRTFGGDFYGIWRSVVYDDDLGIVVFEGLEAFRKLTVLVVSWDDDTQIHELSS